MKKERRNTRQNNQDTRYPASAGSRNTLDRIIRKRDNNQTITNLPKSKFQTGKRSRFGYWLLIIGIYLVIGQLVIGYCSFAQAKEYDGIWFMGINLKHEIFKDLKVRQAVNSSIDKEHIVKKIVSEEVVPVSFIPPGMLGYDPDLEATFHDLKYAKLLMKKAGYPITDKRLKNLSLLHTDGIKTIEIAKKIQNNLRNIGMKVKLVEISYRDEDKWIEELTSGNHDFFLLGYKAGIEQLFTSEAIAAQIDSYDLIEPLFKTDGEVNFGGYNNDQIDKLLGQLEGINIALKEERHKKLKEINNILYKDLPAVVLFYIEKL